MGSSDISFSSICGWLKLKHLLLVDTLARTRNMHAAAQEMNLSQPAISKMLRDLEELLGFPLFERLPRSMPPTELGEFVARYAWLTLNEARHFTDQVNLLRKGGHGRLRVGAIFAATAILLPEAIARIKVRRPLLSIEVVEQTSDQLLDMLDHRMLDLVIGRFTDERYQQLFDFRTLAPEPFCLVVNSRHPLCGQSDVPPARLMDWPWILFPANTPIRRRMERAFGEIGLTTPINVVETISTQTFLHLLQAGPMIALLPESMVQAQVQSGLLTILDIPFGVEPQDYGVLTRKEERLSDAAREFVDILLESACEGSEPGTRSGPGRDEGRLSLNP
ncbi:LysR family transcriptional regulator [Sphingomonas oleivorans]|uniref:LysR family transcriptional regulator n=1 Tax=Sphingomonas oleivorans TaxID=1735121 RepID=A0A2T5FY23_9SPHN|nr:LysR family transcriptional regulator [Sphingomonas oleivorans]PTQ11330.1 LysR family transcriptional regulator [Sphingomonas oleivorans]